MSPFIVVYLSIALVAGLIEALGARRPREIGFAVVSGLLWPLAIPLFLWVAFNPTKAERLRRRYGTGADQ